MPKEPNESLNFPRRISIAVVATSNAIVIGAFQLVESVPSHNLFDLILVCVPYFLVLVVVASWRGGDVYDFANVPKFTSALKFSAEVTFQSYLAVVVVLGLVLGVISGPASIVAILPLSFLLGVFLVAPLLCILILNMFGLYVALPYIQRQMGITKAQNPHSSLE